MGKSLSGNAKRQKEKKKAINVSQNSQKWWMSGKREKCVMKRKQIYGD